MIYKNFNDDIGLPSTLSALQFKQYENSIHHFTFNSCQL